MLTYMEIHLYYTLPVVGLLFTLLRPFHSPQNTFRYVFLSIMAFLTASPWDNYIVRHRAWWYCHSCVTAVIGYVPLEEYMFFIIMTLMTVAFADLTMRWHLPSAFIKPHDSSSRSLLIRYVPIGLFLAVGVKAWNLAIPDTRLFYGSCILWYVCPVLALLWFGASEYICRRWRAVSISIIVPTVYLCWVDQVAIAAGTWHISIRTSTGTMVAPNLPLEEFMFFALINVVLVFATCAIDRAQTIIHLHNSNLGASPIMSLQTYFLSLVRAFCLSDQQLNRQLFRDSHTTWEILREASYSFYTASAAFPVEVRQDLGVLYGFCRATDDLADNEALPVEKRKAQIALVRDAVSLIFSAKQPKIHWSKYEQHLPSSCVASLRAFSRLGPVLPLDAINELLDGYHFDLDGQMVKDIKDLEYYSACVASSVGEMCTYLMLKGRSDPWTIQCARDMGLVLQYTNIARDIVTDSLQLGRCYLPRDWLTDAEYNLIIGGEARALGNRRLRELAVRLVSMAKDIEQRALRGIRQLPTECQGGVSAACAVYSAIGDEILSMSEYPIRAYVSKARRAWIVFKNKYIRFHRTCNLNMRQRTGKGKVRAFMVK
ncbi:phytoene synthase [Dichotomocladium elegans]|nr:phytoene synthase [Dichotomocladium elegans]